MEVAALASVLHSFYNGLENMFLTIVKETDERIPSGPQWHRDLLVQVSGQTENRTAVISPELAQKLGDYLGFRHFYRHSYSFFLEWEEFKDLVLSLREIWAQVKEKVSQFLKYY